MVQARDYTGISPHLQRRRRSSGIPTAPTGPSSGGGSTPGGSAPSSGGSSSGGSSSGGSSPSSRGSSSGSGGSGGGGGGGGGGPTKYELKAGARARADAAALAGQAAALRRALNVEFKQALKENLRYIGRDLRQAQRVTMTGYRDRVQALKGSAKDNEKAESAQSGINVNNQIRERNSAVGEAMMQGAGESDQLQAQISSLRNWHANQSEVQRGFYDSLRGINTTLSDLNIDTRTSLVNNVVNANADKQQLWTNYYNQMSETATNLGNTYGMQANYLNQAHEYDGKGGGGGKAKAATGAYRRASHWAGEAWNNPGVPKRLMNWDGRGNFKSGIGQASSHLRNAQVVHLDAKPEGATLREW